MKEQKTLAQWVSEQPILRAFLVTGATRDQDRPLGDEYNHDFLLYESNDPDYPSAVALRKSLVDGYAAKGIVITISIKPDRRYRSEDDRERYLLNVTFPDGVTAAIPAGRVFSEKSQPFGWDGNDASTHFIGVNQPGYWNPGPLPVGAWTEEDPMPFAWVPDAKPKPVAPVPGTTKTDYTSLTSSLKNGESGAGFTDADRVLLQRVATKLGA